MKTTAEIQQYILDKSGVKTSVRKGKGSMKGYKIITPIFQNGEYPKIPFDLARELIILLNEYDKEPKPVFSTTNEVCIFGLVESENMNFKKERKEKPIEEKRVKGWGSKNSQLRLDKAAARYAKAIRRGENRARYY